MVPYLHAGWHGQHRGVEGVAEHLLGPVEEGPGVALDGTPATEPPVEVEGRRATQVATVVHSALRGPL